MIEIIKAFILLLLSLFIVNTTAAEDQPQYAKTDPSQSFKFKEKYPPPLKIPKAKPEWLELIRHVNITSAPVYKNINYAGPQPLEAGKDPYCDWTFTGCLGKDDLYQCPKGQWAVTYDDGPSEFSPKLYDVLDAANIKATFFMVGGQVVKFPDYVLRAYKAGHEIAMHTWTHSYMTTLTNEQIVAELKWNELAIKEVIGVSPRYFRPPYGDIDNRVRDVAAALGFTAIIWNHDTFDWAFASNPKAFNERWIDGNVTEWAKIAKTADVGGISLEHDLYNQTVDAAIRVLPILQKEYTLLPAAACNHQSQLVYKEVTSHKKANEEEKKKDKTPSANKGAEPAVTSSKEVPSTSNAVPHIHAVGISSGLFLLVASLFVFYM